MTRFLVADVADNFRFRPNVRFMKRTGYTFAVLAVLMLMLTPSPVFATNSSIIAPGAKLEKLGDGYSFTEGPSADRDGNVFFTDVLNNKIVEWNATDRKFSNWLKPAGRAIGTYFDNAGNLVVAASEKGELWSVAPDKTVTVLVTDFDGKVFNGPNVLWIRPDGGIYFTDPDFHSTHDQSKRVEGQNVYFVTPDHKTVTRVTSDLTKPIGIVGTPDGKILYIADYVAGKTFAYDINSNGELTNKRLFCELSAEGMTIDDEGNIYLARAVVTVVDKAGKTIERIEVPEPPRNLTFGGKGNDLLFITATGSVYGLQMRVRGAR